MDTLIKLLTCGIYCIFILSCGEPTEPNFEAVAHAENCLQDAHERMNVLRKVAEEISEQFPNDEKEIVNALQRSKSLLQQNLDAIHVCRANLDPASSMALDRRGYFKHHRRMRDVLGVVEVSLERVDQDPSIADGVLTMVRNMVNEIYVEDSEFWEMVAEQ